MFRETLKYYYMKKLRFQSNREVIRMLKIGAGSGALIGSLSWFMYQTREAVNETKIRSTGFDSIIAAAIRGKVSGFGENKLGEGQSLADMIAAAENRASTPYENIRTPRPWEMETEEDKKKFLKTAYKELEEKIDNRIANRPNEEKRVQEQIALIRAKNAEK